MKSATTKLSLLASVALFALPAMADIKIGVTLSTTGPAASLGIPEKNTFEMMPDEIGGEPVEYIILDDASDTTAARHNVEKLISEDNVDVVIGSTTSPNSLAMIEVVAENATPMISLGAAAVIVTPQDEQKSWVFKTPYNDGIIARTIANHMADTGKTRVGVIAFNDAYGESWVAEFNGAVEEAGIEIVVDERYNRTDTSVTAQTLKIMAQDPDAVLVIGSGTPAVLPQATLRERGYEGEIYQTSGVINDDFLRVGADAVEGTFLPAGPVIVYDELPEDHPAHAPAKEYAEAYEAAFGEGSLSTFGGNAWDAMLIVKTAVPGALEVAEPGTPEFRAALRDQIAAIENLPTTHGPMTMTTENHNGYSPDAPVIITITDNDWSYAGN
ncbi:MAG: ABC transporter substrate-binding protein [Pseudomonadota bacterium]|nr:ABC transporter substrate-binding protein [Pseudomonadota bacterium]